MGSSPTAASRPHANSQRIAASPHATAIYSDKYDALAAAYRKSPIDVSFRRLIGPLPADDLTHTVYPYPARLLRHIPRFILAIDSLMADIGYVIDPFCGSGTILVEAQRYGYTAIGIDQNPIAALVSRVKTRPRNPRMLARALHKLITDGRRSRRYCEYPTYLDKWYDSPAISVLSRLIVVREEFSNSQAADFIDLSIALLARRTSIADPRIPVPVRSIHPPTFTMPQVWDLLENIGTKLIARISRLNARVAPACVKNADSRSAKTWRGIDINRETLVFTSPPVRPFSEIHSQFEPRSRLARILGGYGHHQSGDVQHRP